jgi:hypothetical protein
MSRSSSTLCSCFAGVKLPGTSFLPRCRQPAATLCLYSQRGALGNRRIIRFSQTLRSYLALSPLEAESETLWPSSPAFS